MKDSTRKFWRFVGRVPPRPTTRKIFDQWRITASLDRGIDYHLHGEATWRHSPPTPQTIAEANRFVDAIVSGLTRAGFTPSVTLTRTTKEEW